MSNFIEDLIKGYTGQQETPEFRLQAPGETLTDISRLLPQLQEINSSTNLSNMNLGREMENIYDPNQARLRQATTSSILEQLGLGGTIPQDVQQQVVQNALQNNAASGFGGSNAGRGVIGRDLGLTGLNILNQRIGRAASYTRSSPMFSPNNYITPTDIADQILGNQNAQNNFNTFASAIKSSNRKALAGTVQRAGGQFMQGVMGSNGGGGGMGGMGGMMGGGMGGGGGMYYPGGQSIQAQGVDPSMVSGWNE